MHRFTWYSLLAVVSLVASMAGHAQVPSALPAAPGLLEIATIPGLAVSEVVRMPNGRVILDGVAGDGVYAYDTTSKRKILVTRGYDAKLIISPAGDRIAFARTTEDREGWMIWSMPIDPATGGPRGEAQRISISRASEPSFSPDGKLVAFEAHQSTGPSLLAVVPATGGPERILAKFDINATSWSPDGNWVFALIDGRRAVARVPLAGGPIERVAVSPAAAGPTNGDVAFHRLTRGVVEYITTAGRQGEVGLPEGPANYPAPGRPAFRVSVDRSAQMLLGVIRRTVTTRVLTVADGTQRDLLPGTQQTRGAVWSPDGKRVLVQEMVDGKFGFTVMNADGSQRRHHPISHLQPDHVLWSPNGQMVVYTFAVGAPAVYTNAILEVNTGKTRVLYSRAGWFHPGVVWRPDSSAIVLVGNSQSAPPRAEVREVGLDGSERVLRNIGAEFPDFSAATFVSDRLVAAGSLNESALFSLADGTTFKVPSNQQRIPWPAVSRDHKQLFWFVRNADGSITNAQVTSAEGQILRTLSLPFAAETARWNWWLHIADFLPDGRHVVTVGEAPGDDAFQIFLVPLDGGAPRSLARVSGPVGNLFASADGKSVIYDVASAPTTTFYELDLKPILQVAGKR